MQTTDRQISNSWVGDNQQTPAVVRFVNSVIIIVIVIVILIVILFEDQFMDMDIAKPFGNTMAIVNIQSFARFP